MLYRPQSRAAKAKPRELPQPPLAQWHVSKVLSKSLTHHARCIAITLLGHTDPNNPDHSHLRQCIHTYLTPQGSAIRSLDLELQVAMGTHLSALRLHGHHMMNCRHPDVHGARQMTKWLQATEFLYRSVSRSSKAIFRQYSLAVRQKVCATVEDSSAKSPKGAQCRPG